MTILFLALWLQMSAPTMPCQSAKLYYDGVLVDEEPHCGLLNQVINMPTALDDITRQELAEAAQRAAADETDEKPCKMDDGAPCEYRAYVGKIPEPVDVPAVQEHAEAEYVPNGKWPYTPKCPAGFHYGAYHSDKDWPSCEKYTYSCADKSRVLLTSEDRKKHCIKF